MLTYLPKKVQHIIMTVASDPRFDGDKNPSNANTATDQFQVDQWNAPYLPRVTPTMALSCDPFPTRTESMSECGGVLNTSPCTSFHPQSSCTSSCNVCNSVKWGSGNDGKSHTQVYGVIPRNLCYYSVKRVRTSRKDTYIARDRS